MFKIGQKVMCITNEWGRRGYNDVSFPVKDHVYEIRTIERDGNCFAVRLVEIVNPIKLYLGGMMEAQFNSEGFVPIISTFKKVTFSEINQLVESSSN